MQRCQRRERPDWNRRDEYFVWASHLARRGNQSIGRLHLPLNRHLALLQDNRNSSLTDPSGQKWNSNRRYVTILREKHKMKMNNRILNRIYKIATWPTVFHNNGIGISCPLCPSVNENERLTTTAIKIGPLKWCDIVDWHLLPLIIARIESDSMRIEW